MLKVYVAHAMTGRSGAELLAESAVVADLAFRMGVVVFDPVVSEGVTASDERLLNPDNKLKLYWKRDKELIRAAHVLIDLTGPAKSEGVAHEIGYARFFLYKPIIRVWPGLGPSVAWLEDDIIAPTAAHALVEANRLWGTPWKRLAWRLAMTNRCILGYFVNQIREWRNLV